MPDRGEPDHGHINYPAFFVQLDAEGYKGWVSGDYKLHGPREAGVS